MLIYSFKGCHIITGIKLKTLANVIAANVKIPPATSKIRPYLHTATPRAHAYLHTATSMIHPYLHTATSMVHPYLHTATSRAHAYLHTATSRAHPYIHTATSRAHPYPQPLSKSIPIRHGPATRKAQWQTSDRW